MRNRLCQSRCSGPPSGRAKNLRCKSNQVAGSHTSGTRTGASTRGAQAHQGHSGIYEPHVNGKALITFESPNHGSFKSNAQVRAILRIEGFWLVEMDYCETLDNAVHGPADNCQGGVVPKTCSINTGGTMPIRPLTICTFQSPTTAPRCMVPKPQSTDKASSPIPDEGGPVPQVSSMIPSC